jgi:hypothetical protein
MQIEQKITLQAILKGTWDEEDFGINLLKSLGYRIVNMQHYEDYIRVVGEKSFLETKKDKKDVHKI